MRRNPPWTASTPPSDPREPPLSRLNPPFRPSGTPLGLPQPPSERFQEGVEGIYKATQAAQAEVGTLRTWIIWALVVACAGCGSNNNKTPHDTAQAHTQLPTWGEAKQRAEGRTATLALSGRLSGSAGALTANGEASVRLAVGEGGCVQWETFDAKAQTHPLGGSHAFTLSDIDPQTASAAYQLAWAALQAHVLTKLGGPWQALETKHIPLAPSLPPGAHVEPLRAKLLGQLQRRRRLSTTDRRAGRHPQDRRTTTLTSQRIGDCDAGRRSL
jgi:hypothetical protein